MGEQKRTQPEEKERLRVQTPEPPDAQKQISETGQRQRGSQQRVHAKSQHRQQKRAEDREHRRPVAGRERACQEIRQRGSSGDNEQQTRGFHFALSVIPGRAECPTASLPPFRKIGERMGHPYSCQPMANRARQALVEYSDLENCARVDRALRRINGELPRARHVEAGDRALVVAIAPGLELHRGLAHVHEHHVE